MKRLKIWLSNFTLIQQFLAIVFFTVTFLTFFVIAFLNKNIDSFVNNQMYQYIHRDQEDFIYYRNIDNDASNVVKFVYSVSSQRYLSDVSDKYEEIIKLINPNTPDGIFDDSFEYDDTSIIYSVMSFDKEYRLISIVKNDYRQEFRSALLNGVVNIIVMNLIENHLKEK